METAQPQGLTSGDANACTNACTSEADSVHSEANEGRDGQRGEPLDEQADGGTDGEHGPTGEHFSEAMAMLARLPLTDAERAEAVRRLLAGDEHGRRESE